MKSSLVKLSLALLSAVFILGCQDQGAGPVGPDRLVPQFDKAGKPGDPCPGVGERDAKGHCHGDGGSELATVTLTQGMAMDPLPASGKNDDLNVSLGVFFIHDITMDFDAESCTVITGEDGRHDRGQTGETGNWTAYLEAQLTETVTSGSFILKVDKTGLTAGGSSTTSEGHTIKVGYEGTLDGHTVPTQIMLGSPFSQVGDATVTWTSSSSLQDVFEFTGPIAVAADGVGGLKGKRGRRAIACGGDGNNFSDGDRYPAFGLTRRSVPIPRPCAGSDQALVPEGVSPVRRGPGSLRSRGLTRVRRTDRPKDTLSDVGDTYV